MANAVSSVAAQTFPAWLLHHAQVRPNAPAIREKDLGIWQTHTWAQTLEQVIWLAAALRARGLAPGMNVAIIGENRPRLYFTIAAVQALGAVPVPMYQDAVAHEMVYVFQNADIRFAVVEDQEQVDKLLDISESHPQLHTVVYDDPRGLRNYTHSALVSYDAFIEQGKVLEAQAPGALQAFVQTLKPSDTAAMFYTSGTTGQPKGVVLSHANLISAGSTAARLDGIDDQDRVLAYLPMAWIGQNMFSYTQWMVTGFCVACPESASTVTNDMREIGPTYYFAPPRVLEALLTQVTIRMEDASAFKRALFNYFMGVAKKVGPALLDRQAVGLGARLLYALGDWVMYAPLRNALGMSRIKVAYTAGEAIGPDLFVFYRSLGINLKQLYGSTETSVFVCIQPNGEVKPDTVGKPVDGVEVRLSDSGEILIRSPGLFVEYYRNPEATAECKDPQGWFHTGDAGYFDSDGHLKIIDRAKDVGKLSDGTLFAPKYIENKLKFYPYIKEAVAFGAGKDRVCVFINIDFEACGNWAERRNLAYSGYTDLAAQPAIATLIAQCVNEVNADLAADPMLANAQIARFLILHKELDADDGELTRTRKVRRRFISEKFQALVDALFDGRTEQFIETAVQFEDGRAGSISATLTLYDAQRSTPQPHKRAA